MSYHVELRTRTQLTDLVAACAGTTADSLTERALTAARHSVLDWFGCAVSGAQQPGAQRFAQQIHPAPGTSTVLGAESAHWRDAVLLNGVNGHYLDFDDMLPAFSGHPSAAVLPAVMVLAEKKGKNLEDALVALVVGTEVGCWIAAQILPEHYDNGWHATGTLGTFAAAAAVAHLLGLAPGEWFAALDGAATQSAGLKAVFGSVAKPMHAGNAAEAGAVAAMIAPDTAREALDGAALFGPRGFIANYGAHRDHSDKQPAATVLDTGKWALEGVLYKTYASCFMTQSSVDAGHQLAKDLSVDGIDEIVIDASPNLADVCAIAEPSTPTEAKFSLAGTFALAALGADLTTEDGFSTDNLADTRVRDLIARTRVNFADDLAGDEPHIRVSATRGAETLWSTDIDRGTPATDVAAQEKNLIAKFTSQVTGTLSADKGEVIVDKLLHSNPDIADLLTLTRTDENRKATS